MSEEKRGQGNVKSTTIGGPRGAVDRSQEPAGTRKAPGAFRARRLRERSRLTAVRVVTRAFVVALALCAVACGRVGFDALGRGEDSGTGATLSLADATLNVNSRHTMVAAGGVGPYRFAVLAGQASIDVATGALVTPMFSQALVIEVRDAVDAVATATVTVDGANLYYAAGRDDAQNARDEVWRSTDAGATWQQIGRLPGVSYNGGFIVYDDAMLFIAGRPNGWSDAVWRSTDGIAWTQVGQLPETRASFYPAAYDGALWIVGGYNELLTRDQVWRSTDGGQAWQRVGSMPLAIHGGTLVSFDGRLWYLGGHEEDGTGYRDDVWWTTDGAAWTEKPDMFVGPCAYTSLHVDDLGLVQAGGSASPCIDGVHRSTDAVVWQQIGSLPTPSSNGRLLRHRGSFIYAAGAASATGVPGSTAVTASPDAVSWVTRGALPAPRFGGGMVAFTPR